MAAQKNVLLVGFGAVGAIYSLILKRSGRASVTVVARSNYEAVLDHGMHFQSLKYGDIKGWKPDRLFPSVSQAADRPYSHVIVTTKAIPELKRTPDLLAPLLESPYADSHPQPVYVLLQNGLGIERDIYETLKKLRTDEEPKIISTTNWIGTRLIGKDVVEHNDFDRVTMGIYRPTTTETSNSPAEQAVLTEFADILEAGGSEVTIVPEIQRQKYAKNFWNCALGATAAIARYPLPSIFRPRHLDPGYEGVPVAQQYNPSPHPPHSAISELPYRSPAIREYTLPFLHDAMMEIYTLGTVLFPPTDAGPGIDPEIVPKMLKSTARLHETADSKHRPSMLVDVELGRPMELDVVVGEVVRLGRSRGVPMPRVEALYALLLIVQEQLLHGGQGM